MIDLEKISARLRLVEDRLEIVQIIMSHPLAIDAGDADFWMNLWTEDSLMDRRAPDPEKHSGDYGGVYGKKTMREEMQSPELEALRQAGLVHFSSVPSIHVEGDSAIATNYMQLIAQEGNSYRIRRVTISRWEFRREKSGWQIAKRTVRPVGDAEMPELARVALTGF